MALLRKETCNLRHPMCCRHPVSNITRLLLTGWRQYIGCLKLQVPFRRRATDYRALSRKITLHLGIRRHVNVTRHCNSHLHLYVCVCEWGMSCCSDVTYDIDMSCCRDVTYDIDMYVCVCEWGISCQRDP